MAGSTGIGVAWAKYHWNFTDGTAMPVCERHKNQVKAGGGGYGYPLASIDGLEVATAKANREAAALSRPRAVLEQVRDEVAAMVRKEVGRLSVHVQWSDE